MFAEWRDPSSFLQRMDPTFYSPEYVRLDERLAASGVAESFSRHVTKVFKGAFYVLASEYAESGVPFIRVADITSGSVDLTKATFLPKAVHAREAKTQVTTGNLLFAKGGSIGNSAVVPASIGEANISQDVIGARLRKSLDPYYAQAFLSGPSGVQQMVRWAQGNVHPHITNEAIRRLLIPVPSPAIQRAIGNRLRKAERLRELASAAWRSALTRLAECVGHPFDTASFEAPGREVLRRPGYAPVSVRPPVARVVVSDELGAQYFHPRREFARQVATGAARWSHLADLALRVRKKGSRSGFVGLDRIDTTTGVIACPSDDTLSTGVLFEQNDVLFSRLRPYLNKVAIWSGAPGVGSPELLVYRPSPEIDPHYLYAVLKSPIGLFQVIDVTSGSTHPRVDADVVDGVRVPRLDREEEAAIGGRVRAAHRYWSEAPVCERQARSEVENLMDGVLAVDALITEGHAIEQWLATNPAPTPGA